MIRGDRCRLTFIQRDVLDLLERQNQISYDDIACRLNIDRQTAISAVRRLIYLRRVVKKVGRGRMPNCYVLVDQPSVAAGEVTGT